MNLTQKLLPVALLGAEWVLWLLIALSVVSVAVMIERWWYFRATRIDFEGLRGELKKLLGARDVAGARKRLGELAGTTPGIEAQVAGAGLAEFGRGPVSVEKAMAGAKSTARLGLERNLAFLGTLGNNAPFIGLFGTVIGVIRAFHDLSSKKGAGPEVVMGSLSEALIATAVGLLVAIPAVAAFNYFNRRVRTRMVQTDALAQLLLGEASLAAPDATSEAATAAGGH